MDSLGLKSENSTRYIKLWLRVDKIPYGCTLVQVIESYNYWIVIHRGETGKRKKRVNQEIDNSTKGRSLVLGNYTAYVIALDRSCIKCQLDDLSIF